MIGLIGGISWRSTALYHQRINEAAERRGGRNANAESVIVSLRYETLLEQGRAGNWDGVADAIVAALARASAAGATLGLLTAVTPHRMFDRITAASPIPLLHVLDPALAMLDEQGIGCVGVLGTSYTLTAAPFLDRIDAAGLAWRIPDEPGRRDLDAMIQDELTQGVVTARAERRAMELADDLMAAGAEAVLLACTELPLLAWRRYDRAPVVDAVTSHADAAVVRMDL
ncbi:aspartate/glutamate racemase family protein [Phreatobacter cathodiphilus]|uniref:Aspartate racemase n=1 Tax=Phreatobacter cathodiphilus TaxID=1868589 RepID=A0A2S0N9E1_9HYPH|nr:amino acid racemase [Phreatobacter cathodiphilus]AVO44543.1 aspartate racemase [Phreatobacter cathodiphilus]